VLTLCRRMTHICIFVFQAWKTMTQMCVFSTFRFHILHTARTCHRDQFTAQMCFQVFTQVLGIMTSVLITSQSKERPFVLLHSQAIFFFFTQQPFTSSPCYKHRIITERKNFSWKMWLFQNYYDNLSHVSEDIFGDSESGSNNPVRERQIVSPKRS
jgi:hypothetical protein